PEGSGSRQVLVGSVDQIVLRVHNVQGRSARALTFALEDWELLKSTFMDVQQHVLRVEGSDVPIVPDPWTNGVYCDELALGEEPRPVPLPLLIDVMGASLERNCRG